MQQPKHDPWASESQKLEGQLVIMTVLLQQLQERMIQIENVMIVHQLQ